jgi:hypothetical protein
VEQLLLLDLIRGQVHALAGGGSIYALILIATKDICWSITTAPSEVSWEVGKMLRHPDKCAGMSYILCFALNLKSHY